MLLFNVWMIENVAVLRTSYFIRLLETYQLKHIPTSRHLIYIPEMVSGERRRECASPVSKGNPFSLCALMLQHLLIGPFTFH